MGFAASGRPRLAPPGPLTLLGAALARAGLLLAKDDVGGAAADAARYVANADIAPDQAASRVAELIGGGPPGSTRASLVCTNTATGRLVGVTCTMDAPGIVGLLDGVLPDITVTGHSVREG